MICLWCSKMIQANLMADNNGWLMTNHTFFNAHSFSQIVRNVATRNAGRSLGSGALAAAASQREGC